MKNILKWIYKKYFSILYNKVYPNNPSSSAILIDVFPKFKIICKYKHIEKAHPASLTKLMTALIVFEKIREGKCKLTDSVKISRKAASIGGSSCRLNAEDKYTIDDLCKAMIIASGNDAAIALAEHTAGTVKNFVKQMNNKAKELGLSSSHFKNPHGLSAKNHYSTAHDISLIANELLKSGDIINYSKQVATIIKNDKNLPLQLLNTNPFLTKYPGVDGLKTGSTPLAGYCIAVTAVKNKKRLLAVILGEKTVESRDSKILQMLAHGGKLIMNDEHNNILTLQ